VQPTLFAKVAKLKRVNGVVPRDNCYKASAGWDLRQTRLNVFPALPVPSARMERHKSASQRALRVRSCQESARRVLRLPSPPAICALWDPFVAAAKRRNVRRLALLASI